MVHRRMCILLVSLVTFVLCACAGQTAVPAAIVTATMASQPTPAPTQTPVHALPATATPPPSETPLPTATVERSTLPIQEVTTNCLDWVDWDPSQLSPESTLFFVDFNPANGKKSFSAYSSDTGQMEPRPGLPGYLDAFGPPNNPRRFAYLDDQMQVVLVDANGKIAAVTPFKRHWHSAMAWLDEENLLVSYDPVSTFERNMEVFNPITNESQVLAPERSDRYTFQVEDTGHFVWKQMYDPTLTRLIYTRETQSHAAAITMIDVESGEILWDLERASTGLDYPPRWSPDGSRVAIIASGDPEFNYQNFEIFLVDRAGTEAQWVNLREVPGITAEAYQWSPDGRYLAVYGTSIYILDTQEQRFEETCVPLSENGFYFGPAVPILWSPDSQQIIFQRENDSAVVVDLANGTASALTVEGNLLPVSWLAE